MIYFFSSLRVLLIELIGRPFCEFILFKERRRRGQATSGVAGRVYSKTTENRILRMAQCLC